MDESEARKAQKRCSQRGALGHNYKKCPQNALHRWSAHRQPRALPRGHVRRRGGREAHYGNYLDLASGTFAINLILLFIVTRCISALLILLIRTAEVLGACAG